MRRLLEAKHLKLSDVTGMPGLTIREIGPDEIAPFGRDEMLFFNINTPDDYARAAELAGEYRRPIG